MSYLCTPGYPLSQEILDERKDALSTLTGSYLDEYYELEHTMGATNSQTPGLIDLTQSSVVDAYQCWEDPTYRYTPSGAAIKITHVFKTEGFVTEPRSIQDFWVPQTIRKAPKSRPPLQASEHVTVGSNQRYSKAYLKRVMTIGRRAGKAIVERRKEQKENLAAAKFYADGFY